MSSEIKTTIDWYRTRIDRPLLRSLTKKSDLHGLIQSLGHLGLLAATALSSWYSLNHFPVAVTVLFIFIHGTFYAFLLNGFHEMCHRTVFRSKILNEVFLRIFSFLGWYNFVLFRASHHRHHLYTLHPPDDLEVVLPIKYTLKDFFLKTFINPLGVYHLFWKTLMWAIGRVEGEWPNRLFPASDTSARRKLAGWAAFMFIGHLANTIVCFALGLWLIPVLTTFAPLYANWLLFLCNNTQHVGLKDSVPDFRLSCRTFEPNFFIRFLYWQMNYHIEHHMYAAVPFYNLRRLHRIIEPELPPTPKGIAATWKSIFSILKIQRANPDYQFKATLPAPQLAPTVTPPA